MPKRSPNEYKTELGEGICTRLAEGESLAQICGDKTIPSRSTIHRWLIDEVNYNDP